MCIILPKAIIERFFSMVENLTKFVAKYNIFRKVSCLVFEKKLITVLVYVSCD
jgi:hypothetical protein